MQILRSRVSQLIAVAVCMCLDVISLHAHDWALFAFWIACCAIGITNLVALSAMRRGWKPRWISNGRSTSERS
jgi:hypothetical protein